MLGQFPPPRREFVPPPFCAFDATTAWLWLPTVKSLWAKALLSTPRVKIRRLYQDKILAGFAGSTADAFSLFSRFESKLEQYAGNLGRSAVELAKDWRTDKMLRNLEALLVVADLQQTFLISGSGDVIEPDEGIAAIGSGGSYALASARALFENTELPARDIAEKSLRIAGQICIYTNDKITIEELHA